jgi:signal transduction histidine kinase/CheY-like chemotaxis protein/CHASE3 domain sensor protein/HAMP domain-containing protein
MRMPSSDLSISGRLGLGFGALLLVLAIVVAFVFERHLHSAALQQTFMEETAPREGYAHAVEQAALTLGISTRSHLLVPGPASLQRYEADLQQLRGAVQQLSNLTAHDEGASAAARWEPEVRRFIAQVERAVASSRTADLTGEQEAAIREAREAAQQALRLVVLEQAAGTDSALLAMSDARRDVWHALVALLVLMVHGFLALGWLTARAITKPVDELLHVASSLEDGDWQPALVLAPPDGVSAAGPPPRNEIARLARAFGVAAASLERRARRLGADRRVAAATASTLGLHDLAARALQAMADHVHAEVGVVYWRDAETGVYQPVSRHALGEPLQPLSPGEGIAGQAMADQRTVTVRDIPRDTPFTVRLGIDQVPPRSLVAVPLCLGATVHGVVVVASLRDVDAEAVDFLERACAQLAIGLGHAAAHERIGLLAADLRDSNEHLQLQSEELQAQNEEIQAQNEELQVQAEELHVQHEEIQQRTRQLEQQGADLRAHAARLSEADQHKNDFLGVLAHELRNPLAPMVTSLYLLRHLPPDSDGVARAYAVIDRQVRHLSRLTDDLLDVTRISRGKVTLQRELLNLEDVLRDCVEDQHDAVQLRHLALHVETSQEPVWVDGDRTRLCQVLNNLLSNAVKFSAHGSTVSVRLTAEDQDAVLEVSDEGQGIAPELLQDIFQPFTQGAVRATEPNTGLGLGLALVKALVDLHGGTVEAHSEGPGQGASFVVRLPRRAAAAAVTSDIVITHPAPPSHRILIIEDNVDAAITLGEALRLQGHEVDVTHEGADGIERALSFQPDIILCDLGLPGLNGYDIARRLREEERLRSTRLVAVSGYAAEHDRARAVAAGFDRHLAKPLTVERLAATLRDLQEEQGRAEDDPS